MDVTEQEQAESEAGSAVRSEIISHLRSVTPLDRLNMSEVRRVLHVMAERGYTITKAGSPAEAKATLARLGQHDAVAAVLANRDAG